MASYDRGLPVLFGGTPETDINILLLGETGVGKTTFINAFVNYLLYDTLDAALRGEMKVLIPSSFSVTNTETFESTKIVVGTPNDNENCEEDGESKTQGCQSYVFPIGNRLLRLIDAPGVGDTRGVDREGRNFQNILAYISQYEHLNGICILLKPAVTRLNIYFRYCIKELLRHLHVNAKDNIMFVCTNSRATFFKPGETAPILRSLLNDLEQKTGVKIPFDRDNTFMLDNESFRFLAVYKHGIRYFMTEIENFNESWKKSVIEFSRLITRILQCDLHAVQDTQSLNEAQQLIGKLARPIGEIAKLIQENIHLAQRYKTKLLTHKSGDMPNRMPQKNGTFVPLSHRLTVCTSEGCTKVVTVNGEHRVDYSSNCHVGCSLHTVQQEYIGHPIIRRCRALRKTGLCRQCGCHWTKHMHITYQYEKNLTYIELNVDNAIRSTRTPQSIITLIDKRIADLRKEEEAIRRICAKLSKFLKVNSITSYNDDMLEYFHHFIREEQQKQNAGTDNADIIRGLEKMIADYTEEMNLYNSSLKARESWTSNDTLDSVKEIEEIFDLVYELYALPINGQQIREQVEGLKQGQRRTVAREEHIIDLPRGANVSQILLNLKEVVNQRKH